MRILFINLNQIYIHFIKLKQFFDSSYLSALRSSHQLPSSFALNRFSFLFFLFSISFLLFPVNKIGKN